MNEVKIPSYKTEEFTFEGKKWIKIYFSGGKPSPQVRKLLKEADYRWNGGPPVSTDKCWFGPAKSLPKEFKAEKKAAARKVAAPTE